MTGIISKAFSTVKNLITKGFSFIKNTVSTIVSWMRKALGTLFDWIASGVKTAFNTAANVAKAGVKTLVSSIQSYADKQYNTIQLRVGLGDSYNGVMKEFNELLRMSTADRNDLLSIFATFTEVGKKPADVVKYARATVYLSNATGQSLDRITRMLLAQEAISGSVEKVLYRYGVNIKNAKAGLSDIEKIISQMGPEMEALANSSLAQSFANVKNDLIGIKEMIGSIFAGPVQKVANKLDSLLQKVLGKDTTKWVEKIDELFNKIEPRIDKVFEFLGKIIQDPAGFLDALWKDIQAIWNNLTTNFNKYLNIFGYILGEGIREVINAIANIDWTGVKTSFSELGKGLEGFVLAIGQGAGWWSQEEIDKAGGSIKQMFINSWNDAHPDFTLDAEDKWYQNLGKLFDGLWNDHLKPIWTKYIKPWLDDVIDWVKGPFATVMGTVFSWLGEVIGAAISNFLLKSDTIRTVLSALGMPIATRQDQTSSYEKVKDFLPQTITVGNAWRDFRSTDLTSEFLNSRYTGKGFTGTWMQYLETVSGLIGDDLNVLRRVARADKITENATVPSLSDLANRINAALNPAVETVAEAVEDTTEVITGTLIPTLSEAEEALKDAARELKSHVVTLHVQGTSTGYGKGGIQDYYGQNEFKVYPYSKGGPVLRPTLALIGEDGPEFVLSNDMLKAMGKQKPGLPPLNKVGQTKFNWSSPFSSAANALGYGNIVVYDYSDSALKKWADSTKVAVEEGTEEAQEQTIPWYKRLWDAVKSVGAGIGKYIGGTVGLLAQNGAFGSHLGNIYSNAFDEEGTFSWLKLFGAIIQEFLPYLQKGLSLIGGIFDKAFDILGNAVQILGEEIGNTLMPILEAFIPFLKTLADIVIALAPVVSSVLSPAIKIIALALNVLTKILDVLMPVFAGLASVIQWVSDAISFAIGSVINWLASFVPWISPTSVSRPKSIGEYYDSIMGSYNANKANSVTGITASAATASQTVSYSGATHITMEFYFDGALIAGTDGARPFAKLVRDELENLDYYRQ